MSDEPQSTAVPTEKELRDATQQIIDRLLKLDQSSRDRVLRTVATFYEIEQPLTGG